MAVFSKNKKPTCIWKSVSSPKSIFKKYHSYIPLPKKESNKQKREQTQSVCASSLEICQLSFNSALHSFNSSLPSA